MKDFFNAIVFLALLIGGLFLFVVGVFNPRLGIDGFYMALTGFAMMWLAVVRACVMHKA